MKILAKPIYMIAVFSPEEKPIPYKFKMREGNRRRLCGRHH